MQDELVILHSAWTTLALTCLSKLRKSKPPSFAPAFPAFPHFNLISKGKFFSSSFVNVPRRLAFFKTGCCKSFSL